jgi:FMN-dependent NADH-azoreductase
MTNLLHIKSSIFGGHGQSSQLSDRFVAQWRDNNAAAEVTERDLAVEAVPHLDGEVVAGFMSADADRNAKQLQAVALSEELIGELQVADIIVLGLPMYNFGIPSTLKAWIDHVARAGITFQYTENGPEGLLKGKKAYVIAARGGLYEGSAADTQTPYIKTILGFMGITDVTMVAAEGLNMGDDAKAASLAKAQGELDQLVSGAAQAA